MKLIKNLFILGAFLPLMTFCQSTKSDLKSVSSQEFKKIIESQSVFLVDVRTEGEFQAGHIKGAINIDVNNPEFASLVKSKLKVKSLALYCRSGNRSKFAASKLSDLGVTIYELNSGFKDWVQAGLPVEN